MRKPVVLMLAVVVVAAAAAVASCDDDDSGGSSSATTGGAAGTSEVLPCTEAFADGVVFDTLDEVSAVLCDPGDGTLQAFGTASDACTDGRTLYWNDEGWGYLGEPFARHAAGAEKVPPEAERTACTA